MTQPPDSRLWKECAIYESEFGISTEELCTLHNLQFEPPYIENYGCQARHQMSVKWNSCEAFVGYGDCNNSVYREKLQNMNELRDRIVRAAECFTNEMLASTCPHWDLLSRDSSVGIALGYRLDDRGSKFDSRGGGGVGNFSLHHRVPNGSGTHPVSYPMGTRGSYPGGKAAGAWSWPLTSI
jgi:hypothetical protein